VLPGLTQSRDSLQCEVSDSQALSPDRKWLLYSARWGDCLLAEINGKRSYLYSAPASSQDSYRHLYWLPDSLHWVEAFGANRFIERAWLHDVQRPNDRAKLTWTTSRASPIDFAALESVDEGIEIYTAARPDPDSRTAPPRPHDVDIASIPLSPSKRKRYLHVFQTPPCTYIDNWRLSPRRGRILWELVTAHTDRVAVWLNRIPFVRRRAESVEDDSLWISDIAGTKWRCLGSVRAVANEESPLFDLDWLPSEKRISFWHDSSLYTLPAD
jgi:hypothetical protein